MKKTRKLRGQKELIQNKSNINKIKKVLKIFACVLIALIALIPIKVTEDVDGYEKPHIIIWDYASLLKKLSESEITLQELSKQDPIQELITSKLRPIQEGYSSILKQTIIYEDMMKKSGRGPGSGPTNFVESSTKELDGLYAAVIMTLDLPLSAIWNTYLGKITADMKIWKEAQQLFQNILKDGAQRRFLEWQIETNITFTNLTNETAPAYLNVDKMQKLLEALAGLQYEKYEKSTKVWKLTEETEAGSNTYNELSSAKKELEKVLEDLSAELELNRKYYKFTYHFLTQQYAKLSSMCSNIQDANKKFEFVNLRNHLTGDILGLKERLQRLLD